jgi:hypothetical protein
MGMVRLRAFVVVAITALVLTACTSSPAASPTTVKGTGVVTRSANLSSLERQEVAAANKAWAGVGSSNLPSLVGSAVRLSRNASFVSGDAKLAFVLGRIAPPTRFPSAPRREGRWALISAQQALRLLNTPTPPVSRVDAGPPDKVLRVVLGTDIWETAHGIVRLPAWLFSISGLKGTASVLALSSSDLFQPRHVSEPPPGPNVSIGRAELGAGDRTITLGFVGGPIGTAACDDTYRARVVQEKAIIVVFVAETRAISSGEVCELPGYGDHLSVKLTTPIGSRILVDGVSASAIPFPL